MRVSSRSANQTALAATMVSTALLLPEIACSSSKAIAGIVCLVAAPSPLHLNLFGNVDRKR